MEEVFKYTWEVYWNHINSLISTYLSTLFIKRETLRDLPKSTIPSRENQSPWKQASNNSSSGGMEILTLIISLMNTPITHRCLCFSVSQWLTYYWSYSPGWDFHCLVQCDYWLKVSLLVHTKFLSWMCPLMSDEVWFPTKASPTLTKNVKASLLNVSYDV